MPVIKVSQAIKPLSTGQTVEVIATDKGALSDIPAWAGDMGHTLKEQFEEDSDFHFVVEKG
jgi:tRNA 2-thiouridine synthesizing protein A